MGFDWSRIGHFLRRYSHWIGLFGIVFGTTLSVYFYFASKQVGELSLSFRTVKIAQAGVPVLKILDDKGDPISVDVYGLEVVIWNTGDLSFGAMSDRVRKPLTISIKGAAKILAAVVQEGRNINVADVTTSIDPEQRFVSVNWRQLDPTDAVKIFVIYTGQNQSSIDYSARIIGARLVSLSEYKETDPEATGLSKLYYSTMYDWENRTLKLVLSWLAIVLQLIALGIMMLSFGSKSVMTRASARPWITILMLTSMASMILSSTSVLSPKIPF